MIHPTNRHTTVSIYNMVTYIPLYASTGCPTKHASLETTFIFGTICQTLFLDETFLNYCSGIFQISKISNSKLPK